MFPFNENTGETNDRRFLLGWSGWFLLMNFFVFVVFVSRYMKYAGNIEGVLPTLYVPLAIGGHVFSLILIFFLLIILPGIILFPRAKYIFASGVFFSAIIFALVFVDFGVYSQYRFHINSMVIELVLGAGGEIFDFTWTTYLFVFSAFSGLLVFEIFFVLIARKIALSFNQPFIKYILIGTGGVALFSSNIIHAWADAAYYRPIISITRHLPAYRPLTAKRFMEKHGWADLTENREISKMNKKYKNESIQYPKSELKFQVTEKTMNIIFIVIDSMRYDMLTSEIVPEIKNFSDRNSVMTFSNHTSGGNGTRTGIFTLFYGILGSNWTVMEHEQIGPVFIDTLLEKNYRTGIFASATLTTPAFNQTVFRNIDDLRMYSEGDTAWERDQDILNDWEKWFDERDKNQPFFSFLFFDSAHAYQFPPDYPRLFQPVLERVDFHKLNENYDPVPFKNRYKTALHYIDSLIGQVFKKLESNDTLKNTIVVITSDHGQEFNDNNQNYWGHGSNYTKYQLQVPLVIFWPGKERTVYTHMSNHIDVIPTLMTDLFGCANPVADYSNGRSLFDTGKRDYIFAGGTSTQAIVESDRLTVTHELGNYEIYDPGNNTLRDAILRMDIVKAVIEEKSVFYK